MTVRQLHLAAVVGTMVFVAGPWAATALADVILEDANSTLVFDLESAAGMGSWTVDGVDHMERQWFWYRLGASGGESSIDTLSLDFFQATDTNADGQDDMLRATYTGQGFRVDLGFKLTGGEAGSGTAGLLEIMGITNTGSESLDFHFFQYTDFDLGGDGSDDVVTILSGNSAAQQVDGCFVAEVVQTPRPSHYEAGLAPDLLAALQDDTLTTLGDLGGPVRGNGAWTFEWDKDLQPGDTLLISTGKNVIPEPATWAILGLGGVLMAFRRRRR
jgi:hypothetical protein